MKENCLILIFILFVSTYLNQIEIMSKNMIKDTPHFLSKVTY